MRDDMPVAIISNATRGNQKVLTSTAAEVVEAAKAAEIKPPSLLVIGEVVQMRAQLNWFENRPLFGKRIVVTRARAQSSQLSMRLRTLGADVVELPAIRIEPRPVSQYERQLENLCQYSWLVLTSENGVNCFMEGLFASGKDARALSGVKVAVIGSGTEKALLKYGIRADLKPERFVAEGLIDALESLINSKDRVLVARASEARDVLIKWLESKCAVEELHLYDTVIETNLKTEALEAVKGADLITFTSASTVKYFMTQMESAGLTLSENTQLVSIGPITSEALVNKGLKATIEASKHDIDGMIEAMTKEK
jgi:uroporphyrinogen III methyltransferase/synthase